MQYPLKSALKGSTRSPQYAPPPASPSRGPLESLRRSLLGARDLTFRDDRHMDADDSGRRRRGDDRAGDDRRRGGEDRRRRSHDRPGVKDYLDDDEPRGSIEMGIIRELSDRGSSSGGEPMGGILSEVSHAGDDIISRPVTLEEVKSMTGSLRGSFDDRGSKRSETRSKRSAHESKSSAHESKSSAHESKRSAHEGKRKDDDPKGDRGSSKKRSSAATSGSSPGDDPSAKDDEKDGACGLLCCLLSTIAAFVVIGLVALGLYMWTPFGDYIDSFFVEKEGSDSAAKQLVEFQLHPFYSKFLVKSGPAEPFEVLTSENFAKTSVDAEVKLADGVLTAERYLRVRRGRRPLSDVYVSVLLGDAEIVRGGTERRTFLDKCTFVIDEADISKEQPAGIVSLSCDGQKMDGLTTSESQVNIYGGAFSMKAHYERTEFISTVVKYDVARMAKMRIVHTCRRKVEDAKSSVECDDRGVIQIQKDGVWSQYEHQDFRNEAGDEIQPSRMNGQNQLLFPYGTVKGQSGGSPVEFGVKPDGTKDKVIVNVVVPAEGLYGAHRYYPPHKDKDSNEWIKKSLMLAKKASAFEFMDENFYSLTLKDDKPVFEKYQMVANVLPKFTATGDCPLFATWKVPENDSPWLLWQAEHAKPKQPEEDTEVAEAVKNWVRCKYLVHKYQTDIAGGVQELFVFIKPGPRKASASSPWSISRKDDGQGPMASYADRKLQPEGFKILAAAAVKDKA